MTLIGENRDVRGDTYSTCVYKRERKEKNQRYDLVHEGRYKVLARDKCTCEDKVRKMRRRKTK